MVQRFYYGCVNVNSQDPQDRLPSSNWHSAAVRLVTKFPPSFSIREYTSSGFIRKSAYPKLNSGFNPVKKWSSPPSHVTVISMLGTGCPAASWTKTWIKGCGWSGLHTNRVSFKTNAAPRVGVGFAVLGGRTVFVAWVIGTMPVEADVARVGTSRLDPG